MFREICKQMNGCVDVTFRTPIQASELEAFTNRNEITDFLRQRTYGLDPSQALRQQSV
jgi:hypothetical protein